MTESNKERLIQYVTQDLPPDARARVEAELRQDEKLRDELLELLLTRDEVRTWATTPAPGVEKTAKLISPTLPARSTHRQARWLRQVVATALVFAMGYAVGNFEGAPSTISRLPSAESGNSTDPQVQLPVTENAHQPVPGATSTPATEASPPASEAEPPVYTRQEDGRVIVQTVLRSSGTRATWIVDGEFRIAQSDSTPQ